MTLTLTRACEARLLYNTDQLDRFIMEQGKDRMLIYPGGPPVQGFKGKFKAYYEYFSFYCKVNVYQVMSKILFLVKLMWVS